MWIDRITGLVVILLVGLVVFGLGQALARSRGNSSGLKMEFSPLKIEEKVLGVISKFRRGEDGEALSEELSQPAREVEKKANELIEEIKGLPQEQVEVVKERLYKQVCEEVLEGGE